MDNCEEISKHGTKVPCNPGWNDPPKLSYNNQQSANNRPRNFLNKRVAYPLSGSSPCSVNITSKMPPLPNPTAVLPVSPHQQTPIPTSATTLENDEKLSINSDALLSEVKNILLKLLNNSSELGPKANDIKRRIGVMEDMWGTGKLNNDVQMRMKNLAMALKEDEPNKADEIHRALMVDHVGAVGTWMPGVKQLIHHCIARSELMSIDKDI